MSKIVSIENANYDVGTNTLTAHCKNENGEASTLEFDGLAFANLMGLANIKNATFRHVQLGTQLPWMQVTGIQTGIVTNKEAGHSFGLTLLVHQVGILNFLLPPPVEIALREKLQMPKAS